MEISYYLISVSLMVSFVAITTAMSIPDVNQLSNSQLEDEDQKDYSKRATWMNTRELDDQFVNLVDMALHKLSAEGRVNPELFAPPNGLKQQKRGVFQGFCFKKTSSGRYLPYVCWKSDRRRK